MVELQLPKLLTWVRFPSPAPIEFALSPPVATGYNCGYTMAVKTAISIPDAIFAEAERLAKIRGWSRSELYANAVSAYVKSEKFLGVRERLDAVYGPKADDSAVDPGLAKAQASSLLKEKW